MKPKLYIHVNKAGHFLSWELPYFQRYFDLVSQPDSDAILFAFGPDALASGAILPAKLRVILLFPGFSYNPYHDVIHRLGMQQIIRDSYKIVFTNPGPIHEAFKHLDNLYICPFSVNTDLIKVRQYRKHISSLLHASADYPQKDWTRSRDIMRLTRLPFEIFPQRSTTLPERLLLKFRKYLAAKKVLNSAPLLNQGYEAHQQVINKYHNYDGFVHIAAETPPYVDGKYTATLLEAGLTGSILFWHDTLGLGNDFETIFNLPLEPEKAAIEILQIRKNIDIEAHSKRTVEEIYDRVNPEKVITTRLDVILENLG